MSPMPTVAALDAEWEVLCQGTFPTGPYAGVSAAEVVASIRDDPDSVLLALVGLAQDGDQLAGSCVVQALLGKLVRLAVADRRLTIDDLVPALWIRIGTYPCDRRPAKVAANLVLDARKDVLAEQRGLRVVPPIGRPKESPSAAEVLDAAFELGLIDRRSREILGTVFSDGLGSAAAAARHATTATAIRWRCSRDVRKMARRSAELWQAAA